MSVNSSETPSESQAVANTPNEQVGRNEPCPCGSGKKYKRCHGVDAAPKLSAPKAGAGLNLPQMPGQAGGLPFDPSQMDPAVMAQVSQAIQRLPKAHLHKLQTVMQRAMAGKDVTQEAAELERMLPGGFKSLLEGIQGGAGGMGMAQSPDMSTSEARKVVEEALKAGKISKEEAEALLSGGGEAPSPQKKGLLGKLFGKKS
jgi:hypothetical protein